MWRGYYPLSRDERLKRELEAMIDSFLLTQAEAESRNEPAAGRLGEGRLLAVVGDSGTGKSRLIARSFGAMPEFEGYARADGNAILLSIVAPSPCTLKLLGQTLLGALGYGTTRDIKENVVWAMVRHQLRVRGIRFLHIDELQHLLQVQAGVQKVLDTLKGLMQTPEWPIWLVLSGLPSVADIVETDVQIRRRCTVVRLTPLSLSENRADIAGIFSQYARRANVRPKETPSDDFFLRLLHASHGAAGILIELVQDAVMAAADEKAKEVGVRHFASVYARRTGCEDKSNPFLVDDWEAVDAYRAISVRDEPEDAGPIRKPRNRRKP